MGFWIPSQAVAERLAAAVFPKVLAVVGEVAAGEVAVGVVDAEAFGIAVGEGEFTG